MTSEPSLLRPSFWTHVAPAVLYVALIFVGGSIPMPELPQGPELPSDKLMHLVAFGGMQMLIFRAVRWLRPLAGPGKQNLLAALIACGAGALLEIWQAALPHRSAELADWLADTLGVLLGAALIALVARSPATVEAASEPGEGRG